ncbi:TPA: cation transporting ATPase C-terminal domain-containing protein [Listeria monocytogenes]|nr:cation transporting ATPase C-terminal domain-containing protein [Listeria monocytogenes]HDT8732178.1 cation transporting ATPase C-terminal domain-containing protein [Listeria monocytogenes]HDT8982069.1 cation transporting ATPase C-terminal domain-containing protein [Listeria monocytogenes]HDT9179425.1 cation transporting ATPase C-terminal domain-containing protein [Listeria monocytogenes]HDT9663848.1 cation transporting ATPase C-terminal domain-containing protein [Listeria monocytogenes]
MLRRDYFLYFDARSSSTLFRRNPFGNPRLVLAVLFAGISSYLITIIPFFNTVIGTAQLPMNVYLMVLFILALPTLILSSLKELLKIKIWQYETLGDCLCSPLVVFMDINIFLSIA